MGGSRPCHRARPIRRIHEHQCADGVASGARPLSAGDRPEWCAVWSKRSEDAGSGRTGGTQFAAAAGASSIADLRTKSAEQILNGGWQAHGTVIDGWVLPESIYAAFEKGRQNDVPLLTGWTANDTGRATSLSADDFMQQARQTQGADADSFLKIYPASSDQEAKQSQIAVVTDRMFGWNAWTWARMHARTGRSPAYLYYFSHVPPHPDAVNQGAFHGADIYYVLRNFTYKPWAWTPMDRALSDTMSSYWVNFAATGNPNGPGLPAWPAYLRRATK